MFKVSPPYCWPELKKDRVSLHFKIFGLSQLYSANAAQTLVNIEYSLQNISDRAGVAGVRLHLSEQEETHRDAWRNSWQTAMYEALVESEWFLQWWTSLCINQWPDMNV
jgi:hypothetical protein